MANNDNNINSKVTILSQGTIVRGNIFSKGDIRVDGKIEGNIECDGKIVAGTTSDMKVDIKTNEMNINGSFEGDIVADNQLNVGSQGNITGNVKTPVLSVEEGAVMNGTIEMPTANQNQKQKVD